MEFAKHLRSTHFVLILTSLVIAVGLSSARDIYSRALEQLHDVLELNQKLSRDDIIARLREQTRPIRVWHRKEEESVQVELTGFLEASIAEHLVHEGISEVMVRSVTTWTMFKESWFYRFDQLEDLSFLYTHAAILASPNDRRYYFGPGERFRMENLADFQTDIDALLAYETIQTDISRLFHTELRGQRIRQTRNGNGIHPVSAGVLQGRGPDLHAIYTVKDFSARTLLPSLPLGSSLLCGVFPGTG